MPVTMDGMREPNPEEVDRQPLAELYHQIAESRLEERVTTLSGLSSTTIRRAIRQDPTVGYTARVRLWKGCMVALDERREDRERTTPAGSVRKPVAPNTEPDLIIFEALWLSVRTQPCNGALHVYGGPGRKLMDRAYAGGAEDVDLRDIVHVGRLCSLNTTSRHIPDDLAERLAQRTGIERNIWGDLLYDTSAVVAG